MKLSESWLREWINTDLSGQAMCERLTMAGLEVEGYHAAGLPLTGVVVGEILTLAPHPVVARLKVCTVTIGLDDPLVIVCGASNAAVNMRVPVAQVGAILANNRIITKACVQGVDSQGMLCALDELGLEEQSEGLFELPTDAPVGMALCDYLQLNDHIFTLAITPNRGDCLSVKGLAQELSALTQAAVKPVATVAMPALIADTFPLHVAATVECPRYVGRIIRAITTGVKSPLWLTEKLRRSGMRSIHPVVDVMNYVMVELGQPMHAFDYQQLMGGITVRKAVAGETIHLLNDQTVTLEATTLVIADQCAALAIAGTMGGVASAVTAATVDILLESAYFQPSCIAQQGRNYHLYSESSYRFERGVDPKLQRKALERATKLLVDIVGGQPGPVVEYVANDHLPQAASLHLRQDKISQVLGFMPSAEQVASYLQGLGFGCCAKHKGWDVVVPPRRSDISLDVDLIEEIARLHGYENIPHHLPTIRLQVAESSHRLSRVRNTLCVLGYSEAITYSFIDPVLQKLFEPAVLAKPLLNPMTAEMAVMRTSLWPGLVTTYLYNQNRQQSHVKCFETGLRFRYQDNTLLQETVLAGLCSGIALPAQWAVASRATDFFDLKGDVQTILNSLSSRHDIRYEKSIDPSLHPGQSALINYNGQCIGRLGQLHPSLQQALAITEKIFLFEIELERIVDVSPVQAVGISKFPAIQRDLAFILDKAIPAQIVQDIIKNIAGDLLIGLHLFDVYEGSGVAHGCKSLAVALTLQHATRTLIDEEVVDLLAKIVTRMAEQLGAKLRS